MPESNSKPQQGRIEKPLAGSSGQSWTNRVGTLFVPWCQVYLVPAFLPCILIYICGSVSLSEC